MAASDRTGQANELKWAIAPNHSSTTLEWSTLNTLVFNSRIWGQGSRYYGASLCIFERVSLFFCFSQTIFPGSNPKLTSRVANKTSYARWDQNPKPKKRVMMVKRRDVRRHVEMRRQPIMQSNSDLAWRVLFCPINSKYNGRTKTPFAHRFPYSPL